MRGVQDRQLADETGVHRGKLSGEDAAPVVPHDQSRAVAQCPDKPGHVFDELRDTIVLHACGPAGLMVASQIRGDGMEPGFRQGRQVVPGIPAFREAVQQEDGLAAAGLDVVQTDPADGPWSG